MGIIESAPPSSVAVIIFAAALFGGPLLAILLYRMTITHCAVCPNCDALVNERLEATDK
jgi:hypothetical protein